MVGIGDDALKGVAESWDQISQQLGDCSTNASNQTELSRGAYSSFPDLDGVEACAEGDSSLSDMFETLRQQVIDLLNGGGAVASDMSDAVSGAGRKLHGADQDAAAKSSVAASTIPSVPLLASPGTATPGAAPSATASGPAPTGAGGTSATAVAAPVDPSSLTGQRAEAYDDSFARDEADGGMVDSYDDLLFQNDKTDALTADGQCVVDIKHVVDPATGADHWIVSVPSQTEWAGQDPAAPDASAAGATGLDGAATGAVSTTGDTAAGSGAATGGYSGSVIDLSALGPDPDPVATGSPLLPSAGEQQSYQAGVLQAMHDAGVPDGADVLFTGTGQGGYLAAGLAADTGLPYHCVGLVTAGMPVGEVSVPADVPVVSFESPSDPFTQVDLDGDGVVGQPTGSSCTQVVLPDTGTGTFDQHDYADAVAAYLQTDPTVAQSHPEWFGQIESHEMYTWTTSAQTVTQAV